MNIKLKLPLIHRYSDQGFALPIAIGMGFVMVLIAVTLLMRSQNDQAFAKTQMHTAQSLSISELGVTRALAAFKKNSTLTKLNYGSANDNWSTPLSTDASQLVGTSSNRWVSIPGGEFKIISYTPNDPSPYFGKLKVSGRTPEGAISTLSVQIAYSNQPSNSAIATFEWHQEEASY